MIIKKTIPNSFIYKFIKIFNKLNDKIICKLDYKNIVVKIGRKYYLFVAESNDFSDLEIQDIYNKEQIYINIKMNKVSHNFLIDYRKLYKNGFFFEIEKKNIFIESEIKVKNILKNFFIGNCLDIGCGDSLYKDIFKNKYVNYLGIDIHKVNNGLNIIETKFEDYKTNNKFDIIFFFRSINHFSDTRQIINKAYSLLNNNGKIFIVENEAFGEIKFIEQMFEGKKSDFEHFFNYSLEKFKKIVGYNKFNILEEENITSKTCNQWYILLEKNENISNKS